MKNKMKSAYATRDTVLKLLSDDEVAKVSTAETAARLAENDEYLDMEHLERGVQRAHGATPGMGGVLPRTAVHEGTWSKILAHLESVGRAAPHLVP